MLSLYVGISLGVLLFALICQPQWTLLFIGILLVVFIILVVGFTIYVNYSPRFVSRYPKPTPELDAMRRYFTNAQPRIEKPLRLPVIYGRMVDGILQQLMDLALRDYVGRLFNDLGFKSDELIQYMKIDIWKVIQNLQERLSKLDQTTLIAVHTVNKVTLHFENIRIAQGIAAATGEPAKYKLSPHLSSIEAEKDYLRKLVDHSIELLFPPNYKTGPMKHLLREILTCKVFYPAICMLTDPDFINLKIIAYIEYQAKSSTTLTKKNNNSTTTFEDFVQMIKNCTDPDDLKHIRKFGTPSFVQFSFAHRYNIVSEIMQATTLHNLKKSKGLNLDIVPASGNHEMQDRQLRKYISQLSRAKSISDKRLKALGASRYPVEEAMEASYIDTPILPLKDILNDLVGRRYLTQYLEVVGSPYLIGFWAAVEDLRTCDRSNWYQIGAEIFYTYINTPSPEIKVEKAALKRMEGFLLGDSGPEVFYEVQENVMKTLEEKFYRSFLTHDLYQKMLIAMEEAKQKEVIHTPDDSTDTNGSVLNDHAVSLQVVDQSNYAGMKLERLQEKLDNKMRALEALRTSLKPDSKVLVALEKEVEKLEGEKRQLEAHVTRTEVWGEHLGQWRATVQSAELSDDKECPQFIIVVHIVEDETDGDAVSTGWVVLRKLSDFQDLHRKLCQLNSEVKQFDLPSQSIKYRFGKQAVRSTLQKAKTQIQNYLKFVMEDERLNQSEALYAFLSPSSEHLKYVPLPSPKKSGFSLTTLFKSGPLGILENNRESPNSTGKDSDEEDITLLLDDGEGRTAILGDAKDGIAEPLYVLLGEIFDMRGVFKWLRKTLIMFVQVTYGRTINRQINETIQWLFSDEMMYFYIKTFIKSWWPNGKLLESPPRTEEQKMTTSIEAREQLLSNIPEFLSNLVGQQSARRGFTKMFNTLQEPQLNRQLFYDLLELLISELCPELKSPSEENKTSVEVKETLDVVELVPDVKRRNSFQ